MNARIPNLGLLLAQETHCDNIEEYGRWLECAPTEREPSAYFVSISTKELVQLSLNHAATDEQLAAAQREIRERFLETLDVEQPDADAFRGYVAPTALDSRPERVA